LDDLYAGHFEAAVQKAREGAQRFPGNAELTETLLLVQDQSITRLLGSADDARGQGDEPQARAAVDRATAIAPRDERVRRARNRLDLDAKVRAATKRAAALLSEGRAREAGDALRPAVLEDGQNAQVRSLRQEIDAKIYQEVAAGPRLPDSRPLTLAFRDAPVRQVFDAISHESGITFVLDKDIRPDARVTIFAHRVSLEKALDLLLDSNQLARKMIDPKTVQIYPSTPDKIREYQELIIRTIFLSHINAKEAAAVLKGVLKIREPYVDERMNMIVLREASQQIEAAEKLLGIIDQADPEVMVDVAVLEVNSSKLLNLGIEFPDNFSLTPLPPASAGSLTLGNIAGLGRNRLGLGLGGATVNLQSQDGDATVLANPRIRARNREKAHILIGDKYPIVSASAAPNAGFVSENITYIDVGIKVDIEPIVGLDGDVTIKLDLEVSSIANKVTTNSGSVAYQIGTRSAGTTLRLQDGETQILGGLISRNDTSSANRLPGLGDLPIAGRLFSSQNDSTNRDEVLLSITPHIISNLQRPDAANGAFYSGTDAAVRLLPAEPVDSAMTTVGSASTSARARPVDAPAGVAGHTVATTRDQPVAGAPSGGTAAEMPVTVPTRAPGGVALLLNAPVAVQVGEEFTVTITADIAVPLRGLPINLNYDSTRLKLADFEAGPLLGEPRDTSVAHSVDPVAGRISLAIVQNGESGLSGKGVLGNLRFTALQSGSTHVDLLGATPLGLLGAVPQPTVPPAAQLQIR
jgi:general secretion pathway protein D